MNTTLVAIMLLALLGMARNAVVYEAHSRRLGEMLDFINGPYWQQAAQNGWSPSTAYQDTYYIDMLSLHKWTYAQFYPLSVEECAFGRRHV
jgi:hypothetical protein